MTEQLKPCPFCGGINVIHSGYHMYCHACGAEGPDADSDDESAAIAAWNRRAQPAQPGAEPMAWMDPETKTIYDRDTSEVDKFHGFAPTVPLYTHPPARVPLTTDEITKCWGHVEGTRHGYVPFAHAIIAAYEAKNGIGGGK